MEQFKKWTKSIAQSVDYKQEDAFYYWLIISAPILMTVYRYFTEAEDFQRYFPALSGTESEVTTYILEYLSFFGLTVIIPLILLKCYKKNYLLKQFLSFSNPKLNLTVSILIIVAIVIPMTIQSSTIPAVLQEYPLPRTLLSDQSQLGIYLLAYGMLYYIGWEFFFRGVLVFGLKEKYGAVAAILIQTISSCLVHIDKPVEEILGSIPFGIVFGIVVIRTKSIWYAILIHAALGIFTDLFIIY